MARFRDIYEVCDFVKRHVDIVDVMSKDLHLEKAGRDLYKALCCFHAEKTPSLTVTPSKGLYHCFGCKASGDVITYVKARRGLTTVEAVRALAEEYGLDLSPFERELTEEEKHKQTLLSINKQVRDRLHELLMSPDGARGYEYLTKERGLSDEVLKEFCIGYSRHIGDSMGAHPGRYVQELELDRDKMWTDAVVFPLHDVYGQVIGFKTRPFYNGRTVDEQGRKLPKFVATSSNSPVFAADDHVYGLHIARRHMENGRLICVEGNVDVLMAHQHGIRNTVGLDGSALNERKLRIMEEVGVRELVVVMDGDAAGRDASLHIARHLPQWNTTIAVKIARLPDGYDPDEFLREHGAVEFLKVVDAAVYAGQYLIEHIAQTMDISSVTGKIDFVRRVYPVIVNAPTYERAFLMQFVASLVGVGQHVIEDMVRYEQAKNANSLLFNVDGEKVVLAGILRDEEFRAVALADINDNCWYLPKHKELFLIVKELEAAGTSINPDTIKAAINNKQLRQLFADGAYVDELYATTGDYHSLKEDIIDKAIRRKLEALADELKKNAQDTRTSLVWVVEEHLNHVQNAMATQQDEGSVDGKRGAKEFMDRLLQRMQDPGKVTGIPLGDQWKNTTNIIDGLGKENLIVVAANQSVGKTTLLCNWINEIAITQKRPWVHFTLEMPSWQIVEKLIGIRAGVNTTKIRRGNLTDEEYTKVKQAALELYSAPLVINDRARTLEQILSICRKLKRTHGIEGVSIDYVQLMRLERPGYRKLYEQLGDISGGLKADLAVGLKLPVVILSQLSKEAINAEIAKAEHGAGSYKIAQDSDIYIILQEKDPEEIQKYGIENGNMKLFIDKNRFGVADVLIDVFFQKDIQRMWEVNVNAGSGHHG